MNKKNNFVFGWFRPRARNLKQNIFYQKRKRGNDCQQRKTSYLFVISLAVVPSILFEATVWAGRVSLPSCEYEYMRIEGDY